MFIKVTKLTPTSSASNRKAKPCFITHGIVFFDFRSMHSQLCSGRFNFPNNNNTPDDTAVARQAAAGSPSAAAIRRRCVYGLYNLLLRVRLTPSGRSRASTAGGRRAGAAPSAFLIVLNTCLRVVK
ncbi:hypothetical protein EVAR_27108_1 [Eumeta japonica]|uniref:Uncharacterized protein n=1 Tax=Eumeta variegata TaxID=151549 RepID=A0A4C1VJ64_EUMVA|nr:hypothetical protein EVAR_27108_1 [Eumeta japonica]